jgi:K+ transporter
LNPFFLLFSPWERVPMVLLATVATVIASQAVISGAFSVTRQAVQLGFLPRLRIRHTSQAAGQIYVPAINGLLLVAVVALVVGFGSSAGLASAYVPKALRQAATQGLEVDVDVENATYFVSQITIVRGDAPGMRRWRKKLFVLPAGALAGRHSTSPGFEDT